MMALESNPPLKSEEPLMRRRWAPTPPGRRSPDHVVLQEGIRRGLFPD